MSALDSLFQSLREKGRKAFMPFVTAGDPDLQFTADLIRELDRRGCSMCEVGFPYSDPIADGPVIQASYTRALEHHVKVDAIVKTMQEAGESIAMPQVAMVSYAIIYRIGLAAFADRLKAAGVAGMIVPDLLVEESQALADVCRERDLSLIQLITPTTPRDRAVRIAESTSGFIYYVSVTGITGERTELPPELIDNVSWLREQTPLPICIGFGISRPDHVRLLSPVADGLIVGSAIVKRIAEAGDRDRSDIIREIGDYAESLIRELPTGE